jgi:acetyl-CoA acetyltransferase
MPRSKVAIVGVGHSQMGRRLERPLGLLAVDACRAAIADAGLDLASLDGVGTFPDLPAAGHGPAVDGEDIVTTAWMIRNLGLTNLSYWNQAGAGNIATSIGEAVHAISSGYAKVVLLFRALHLPRSGSYSQFTGNRALGGDAYVAPYGASHSPLLFALNYYKRYQLLFGARRQDMAAYVLAARRGANANEHAYFYDKTLTFDEYMESRTIAEPLCLYDCDIPLDGAGAILLAASDVAAELGRPAAYIVGYGQGGKNYKLSPLNQMWANAARIGDGLWTSSKLRPADVTAAMLYDGYAPDIYFWLEGLGFCDRGEAWKWIQGGRIERDGALPINTFGGNLSEGRIHGIGHWIEGALQVQGRAGARQVIDASRVLVATGMIGPGAGVILSPDPV